MRTGHSSVCAVAILLLVGFGYPALAQWTNAVMLPPPINTDPPGEYYYSTISADGQVLCITINTDSVHGGYGDDDVWISQKVTDSTWSRPVNAGTNVNNNQRNLSPSITGDRQRLYYVSWTGTTYRIFVSYRTGPNWNDWSVGQALAAPIHRGNEFTCQISFDDSTLVFTSTYRADTVQVFGDNVMYTSRMQADGSWSEPHLIAPQLNWLNGSFHPCLTDSGRTLVYGQYWNPHWDVWYSFRNDTGFGQGFRCDSTINTRFWDSDPSCPVNGSLLYFESRRPLDGGQVDGPARLYVARRVSSSASSSQRPIVLKLTLDQNYPNPFNPTTVIRFSLPQTDRVRLKVYDILGQQVAVLTDGMMEAGSHTVLFDGSTLPSGVYFARLEAGKSVQTEKLVLLK